MGVFRDGLGPRNGQMITITTAGDDSESPLGKMRSQAYGMPTLERDGAYRYARSRSGQWVMHEWALGDTQDREDMAVVKTANPASWQTVEALQERSDDPSTTPWQWARFACGVWLAG
jgi:VCBS repeat-containing protein